MSRRLRFLLLVSLILLVGVVPLVCFWPHLHWRYANAEMACGVEAIPSQPLSSVIPEEELALVRVGPISIELPKAMTLNHESEKVIGGSRGEFVDGARIAVIFLPERESLSLQKELTAFPDKANYTFPRLHKEMLDASSGDFSYAMSRRELQYHRWLLEYRSMFNETAFETVEYHWRSDLEGLLTESAGDGQSHAVFNWATTDNRWSGSLHFVDAASNAAWVRHACATFKLAEDPQPYLIMDDAALNASISVSAVDDTPR